MSRLPCASCTTAHRLDFIPSQRRHAEPAPYSFFNAFIYTPPIVGVAGVGRKDSLINIKATGEFGRNLATQALAEQMNTTCAPVGPEADEFELAGLATVASRIISVPRVAEMPVLFECSLSQILRLTGADGTETDSSLVLGEVVSVHIVSHLLVDGIYDTAAAQPILRAGAPAAYFGISLEHRFEMPRLT